MIPVDTCESTVTVDCLGPQLASGLTHVRGLHREPSSPEYLAATPAFRLSPRAVCFLFIVGIKFVQHGLTIIKEPLTK